MEVETETLLLIQMKQFLVFHAMIPHQIQTVQTLMHQVQVLKKPGFQTLSLVKLASKVMEVVAEEEEVDLAKAIHLPVVVSRKSFLN